MGFLMVLANGISKERIGIRLGTTTIRHKSNVLIPSYWQFMILARASDTIFHCLEWLRSAKQLLLGLPQC